MHFSGLLAIAAEDAKRSWRPLILMALTMALGVAGLVATDSMSLATHGALTRESKNLLGADLVFSSRQEFPGAAQEILQTIPGERAREVSFASMIYSAATRRSRLIQLIGVTPNFPLYGSLESSPPDARSRYQSERGALVDKTLLVFLGINVGDTVRLGDLEVKVTGTLERVPGSFEIRSLVAPRVYVPAEVVSQSQLIQKGSAVRVLEYFRLSDPESAERIESELEKKLNPLHIQIETAFKRQQRLGRASDAAARFLSMIAYLSLVIAALGLGSGLTRYMAEKSASIAVLRSLGASPSEATTIYGLQAAAVVVAGILLGCAIGIAALHELVPYVQDVVATAERLPWSWTSLARAGFVGVMLWTAFCAAPFMNALQVSPLASLRAAVEQRPPARMRRFAFGAFILCGAWSSAVVASNSLRYGSLYAVAVSGAVGVLICMAWALLLLSRKVSGTGKAFVLRQGVANLFRPFNQTTALTVSIGLSVFLLVLVVLLQQAVLTVLGSATSAGQPNLIVFDLQPEQLTTLQAAARRHQISEIEQAPLVSMRLRSVNQRPIEELRNADSTGGRWELTRVYRTTFRSELSETEELLEGSIYQGVWPANSTARVPISLEVGIAKQLGVGVGDALDFDVQGVLVRAEVGSLRGVNWQRLRPNFFVLFPRGVLEEAPKLYVSALRATNEQASAEFQRELVAELPNVSVIDANLLQQSFDAVLGRLTQVLKILGLLSAATSTLVLIAAVYGSRKQRERENALLKVLGASKSALVGITLTEYAVLAVLAVLTAVICATAAAYALAHEMFSMTLIPEWAPLARILAGVLIVCLSIGAAGSLGTYKRSPGWLLR